MPDWLQPWFPDLPSFLRMGRHGAYVWPALGLTAALVAAEWWVLSRPDDAAQAGEGLSGEGRS